MNEITTRPMVYKEARECADQINSNLTNIRQLVVDLHDRDGWSALGYANWTECVNKEFQQGGNYIFKQFAAAQIEQNINDSAKSNCTTVQLGTIPERQLRPLSKLDPDQQREAWQQAVATAPDGKVTAAHVYRIVKEMTHPEPPPKPKLNQPIIKPEMVSPEFQAAFDQMYVELKNASAVKWKTTSHKAALEMMGNLVTITEQLGR